VILCAAHFVTWELAGRYLNSYFPGDVVFRPQKHPVIEWVSNRCRRRHYRRLIRSDDFKGMVRSLKDNRLVWLTVDIDPGRRRKGVFVPFFGVPAYTTTALARLARLTGSRVVPAVPSRREDGSGYDLFLGPPIEGFPSHDMIHDTARVNQFIEEAVRHRPDQYLWQYKRFKNRPSGESRVYRK
jgi:KDO2-lipid IV(A) lauroyltransferase